MTKALLALFTVLVLAGCTTTANLKAMPLKEQSGTQVDADRKRCDEWSTRAAAVLAGFAACMIAAGYETTPEVGSSSQTLRLASARLSAETEPTRVLLEVLDCDSLAKRESETDLGFITRWIRENLFTWRHNTEKRRQVFVDCIKPRGYDVGKT